MFSENTLSIEKKLGGNWNKFTKSDVPFESDFLQDIKLTNSPFVFFVFLAQIHLDMKL